ncbi:sulfatase family protein [Armatimonas rosea]|uniref:Arylsulfatase n=1 Tax=Armatimonas rosea TaxID=685828 RepID=A0A7W9STN8_ARMRO|nr:sulfatase [Armatimonas rosea]MBB6051838.1 arylsulfatase [Armatimonas rosea]
MNIVLIFADDLAYADVGCFGAKDIRTPHIDSLARDGVRFTDFYVAQPVCSASRAALLSGCYSGRVGIQGALGPASKIGISADETILPQVLKAKGFATGAVGKWHLGHLPEFNPTRHGFDEWLGLPYSNDMWPNHPDTPRAYPPLQLMDGEKPVETILNLEQMGTLTQRYTDRAVGFIEKHAGKRPFFLYVAHSMPHVPLAPGKKWQGRSQRGTFGDVIEELDDSVGQVLAALKRTGVERETLVIFTSDNGPWLSYGEHAGSAGPLREGKGTCWDGGVREPFVARWPGHIRPCSVITEPAMTIDLLPTIAKLTGAPLPKNKLDGKDIWPLLSGDTRAKSPQEAYFFYYNTNELQAVRSGRWKVMLPQSYRSLGPYPETARGGKPVTYKMAKITRPLLFDLVADPGETTDLAAQHPEILKRLLALAEQAREELGDGPNRIGKGIRPVGRVPG